MESFHDGFMHGATAYGYGGCKLSVAVLCKKKTGARKADVYHKGRVFFLIGGDDRSRNGLRFNFQGYGNKLCLLHGVAVESDKLCGVGGDEHLHGSGDVFRQNMIRE